MKYTVIEAETLVSKKGNQYKKLTVKAEDADHLEPRTTMFNSHPDFDKAIVGAVINGDLVKEDSGTPIPAHPEKNYINRTMQPEGSAPAQPKGGCSCEARLAKLEAKVFGTTQAPDVRDTDKYPENDIKPEDIPF
jgi:hypothetical protein